MSAEADDMKGRAKEAAGALTGDDELKREGQLDQVAASAKSRVSEAAEKLDKAIDHVKEKAERAANKPTKAN
jgi:uncharacterized protein YjbJ (UPF0337 family)